jgi:lactobin A/cerein 7B family class IIb bacteriocin
MQELTMNEIEQVNGGIAPLVYFGARVLIGWASAALWNKAF